MAANLERTIKVDRILVSDLTIIISYISSSVRERSTVKFNLED